MQLIGTLEQVEQTITNRENVKTYDIFTKLDDSLHVSFARFIIETWDSKRLVIAIAPQRNNVWTILHMGELK